MAADTEHGNPTGKGRPTDLPAPAERAIQLGDGPTGAIRVADLFVTADLMARDAELLRHAQREYMGDRGNEAKGRAVAQAAASLDRSLDDYRAFRARMSR
jgi:hypothetical protein